MYTEFMEKVKGLGASSVAEIAVSDMVFEPSFRSLCESNACGKYGKYWSCPPLAGEAEVLIERAKGYERAIVYQSISTLEDSFDIEGMQAASKHHLELSMQVSELAKKETFATFLNLSCGGCAVCKRCAALDDKPCHFPQKRLDSVDAYCVHVSKLAKTCHMNYINGQNTVTYFSALLIRV